MRRAAFIYALSLLLMLAAGCGRAVKFDLKEGFGGLSVSRVAILPVAGHPGGEARIKELFRGFSSDRLEKRNYGVVPFSEVDEAYEGHGGRKAGDLAAAAARVAGLTGSDAVLVIRITKWDESIFSAYASLKVGAEFTLYSAASEVLWRAEYGTKESDFRLDREQLDLGVLKVYEPRIERIVETVFATLPRALPAPAEKKEPATGKRYFDWL